MKTVLVTPDVVTTSTTEAAELLKSAGLDTIFIGATDTPPGTRSATVTDPDSLEAIDLVRVVAARGGVPDRTFLITGSPILAASADAKGMRAILVLDGRNLDDVLGATEPGAKHMAGASDLVTAAGYAVAEAAETEHLGPSPFSSQLPAAEPVGLPSRGDLLRILALVVMAGTAIALAIAYFLQELYQYFHFPPIVYYLTLQFLPDWGRGVLFLVLGAIVGAIASRALSGASDRRAGTG